MSAEFAGGCLPPSQRGDLMKVRDYFSMTRTIFQRKHTLYCFITEVHDQDRAFACDQCEFVGKSTNILRRHKINRHSNNFRFSCNTCGMMFKCSTGLKLHSYKHIGRTFECMRCLKKFSRKDTLKIHIRTMHVKREVEDTLSY